MSGDLIWAVVRLLLALPLVLGMAYLVIKYGLARRYVATGGVRRMKLVEQLPLGPKGMLSLVEVGGRYYLLASQDHSINLLKELEKIPETPDTKVCDIVELNPRTVEEFDRLQVSTPAYEEKSLTGGLKEQCGRTFKNFAGRAAKVKKSMRDRMSTGARSGEKGEKKVEG